MVKIVPIYIIIFLLIAVLVFRCDTKEPIRNISNVIVYRDTIIKVDTVNHYNIKVDTVFKTDTDTLIEYGYYNNAEYHYKINDSVLDGTIVAKAPFKPEIDFKYKLKNYTIKDSVYVEKTKLRGFYYGGEMVVHPLLSQMFVGVAYQDNRGQIFDVSVGRDFQNESNLIKLGYKKRF